MRLARLALLAQVLDSPRPVGFFVASSMHGHLLHLAEAHLMYNIQALLDGQTRMAVSDLSRERQGNVHSNGIAVILLKTSAVQHRGVFLYLTCLFGNKLGHL